MSEKTKGRSTGREIDLKRLMGVLLRKKWIIAGMSVLCALVTFVFTFYFVTPTYESSAVFYVNNSSISLGDVGISQGDITARKGLVSSYIVILRSRTTLELVIDYADANMTTGQLNSMISAEAVDDTEIFQVTVTSEDPYEAERLANAIAVTLPKRITTIIESTSANIVDTAIVATSPSAPSYTKNTLLGFLVGLALSVCVIVLRVLFDVVIRTEEDVTQICDHPILSAVPDMTLSHKGGYYYGRERRSASLSDSKEPVLIGPGISFAAAEAYKLLRTKLQFSFVDEKSCRILGVSSALAGEGKSLSSINLAYSLAQLDKRVLLIDCDMRRPSLSAKLPIQKIPGLSNYLTHQVSTGEVIQKYTDEECGFDVISSGRNPPNPIELLSSQRMLSVLEEFRAKYDYIIMDLPPVGEVSDAMVASKLADGILLVVRQNYCDRISLSTALKQFEFIDTRILGVVMNCTGDEHNHYSYYSKHKKYYNRYEGYYTAAKKSKEKKN